MKAVEKEALAKKKKVQRAEMERKILKMLDYPFLPTLHVEFEASHFSCIVMELCSDSDLHFLRHKQPHKRFSLVVWVLVSGKRNDDSIVPLNVLFSFLFFPFFFTIIFFL